MNCPDEQDLVAYTDGELDAKAHASVEQHLATCAACSAYVADMCGLTSLGRSAMARLPAAAAAERPALRLARPAWPRVVLAGLATAAAVLVATLAAVRLMSEPKHRQLVEVGPTTSVATTTQSTERVADAATPVGSNDELFANWEAAARRRAPVRLVPMDEVANFRPPVDRPITTNDLNPRG